jgi:Retrotransposon gag protein
VIVIWYRALVVHLSSYIMAELAALQAQMVALQVEKAAVAAELAALRATGGTTVTAVAAVSTDESRELIRQPVVKLESPSKFTGYLRAGGAQTVAAELDDWLSVMEAYLRRVRPFLANQSVDFMSEYASSFLEGTAHQVAERARRESAARGQESVPWAVIVAALRRRFGSPTGGLPLIERIKSVRQGADSVAEFTSRFEAVMDALLREGIGDRTTAVDWFLDGLRPSVALACHEALSNSDGDVLAQFGPADVSEAIAWISDLACRKERFLARRSNDQRHQATAASVSSSATPSAPSRYGRASPAGGDWSVLTARRLAKKLDLPEALIRSRLDEGLCVQCAGKGHRQYECSAPVRTAAAREKAPARANVAQVVIDSAVPNTAAPSWSNLGAQ